MNHMIEIYLRSYTYAPRLGIGTCPSVSGAYNISVHSAIDMTHFEAVYGCAPHEHIPFEPGSTTDPDVERQLLMRDDLWSHLKAQIVVAQNHMHQVYDRRCQDRNLQWGSTFG